MFIQTPPNIYPQPSTVFLALGWPQEQRSKWDQYISRAFTELLTDSGKKTWHIRTERPLNAACGFKGSSRRKLWECRKEGTILIQTWGRRSEKLSNYLKDMCHCPGAAIKNHHRLYGLKQQEFILWQLRRPEVWNQRVSKAVLLLKPLGKNPCWPLHSFWWWPAVLGLHHSSLCLRHHMAFIPVCVPDSKSPSPYKDTSHWI